MSKRVIEVTLVGREGCHLCDEVRPIVEGVVSELRDEGLAIDLVELSIDDDVELARAFSEDIPVVLINGRRHSFWRVDADRLRQAIYKRAGGGLTGFLRRSH